MKAKMIDKLEIGYMSFYESYTVIMQLDTKINSRRKTLTRKLLLKRNEKRAYNGVLNLIIFVWIPALLKQIEKL